MYEFERPLSIDNKHVLFKMRQGMSLYCKNFRIKLVLWERETTLMPSTISSSSSKATLPGLALPCPVICKNLNRNNNEAE
jgi:hypothetical protein